MSYNFTTSTHGKWILAGEHGVLRGNPALVFPLPTKNLTFHYQASQCALEVEFPKNTDAYLKELFSIALQAALQHLNHKLTDLRGKVSINSNLSIGRGIGASAALCVAMARWFAALDWLDQNEIFTFAQTLENLFHGKSSGLDIAGVSASTGIFFQHKQQIPIKLAWQPIWYLSDCGHTGITSHCVQQVQKIWQHDTALAANIDKNMQQSVLMAKLALENNNPDSKLLLATAINKAAQCFHQWGLISDPLNQHMQHLLDLGAIAVKPTGSGSGGYVLSLWQDIPHTADHYIKLD